MKTYCPSNEPELHDAITRAGRWRDKIWPRDRRLAEMITTKETYAKH